MTTPVIDLDHVQIAAPRGCETAAREFYRGLLGLEEIEKPEPLTARGGCWFLVGTRQLHIGVEEPFLPAKKAHPAFAVSDVNALFETLTSAGIDCQRDDALVDVPRFYAQDPWGNRLEFLQCDERN